MPTSGAEILKRYDKLKTERANFDSRWNAMAPFVAPSRFGILNDRTQGQSQTQDVYDSTAIHAADILAKFIAGSITNAATKWFSLRMRENDLNDQDEVREWLDEVRDRMHAELNRSNFYAEVFELYVDYGGFGTGSLFSSEMPLSLSSKEQRFKGLRFETHRIGRYVVAEDALGRVDTFMVEFRLSARAAIEKFKEESLPESVRNANKTEPDKMFRFIHGVYPRTTSIARTGYRNAKFMPWASCYVEAESKQLVAESGFEEFPFFVPRWQKTPGEAYGRGPGEVALPDTKTLNKAKQMGFEDWAMKIRPPVLVAHDSVIGGKIRIRPAGVTVVRIGGRAVGDLIQPYETGSHPEISQIKEEQLRQSIRQIYMVDQILALLEVEKTQMTAYEYAKKIELMQRILGPIYGRLQSEFLNPLIDRTFNIMYRQGAFSQPPDMLLEQGGEIDVEFESPLAKAQRAGEIEALQLALNDAAMMAKVQIEAGQTPDVLDYYDLDEAAKLTNQIRGVPAKVTRSDKQVKDLRAARTQAQAQANQMEKMQQMAQMAGQAAPMVKAIQPQGKAA